MAMLRGVFVRSLMGENGGCFHVFFHSESVKVVDSSFFFFFSDL